MKIDYFKVNFGTVGQNIVVPQSGQPTAVIRIGPFSMST